MIIGFITENKPGDILTDEWYKQYIMRDVGKNWSSNLGYVFNLLSRRDDRKNLAEPSTSNSTSLFKKVSKEVQDEIKSKSEEGIEAKLSFETVTAAGSLMAGLGIEGSLTEEQAIKIYEKNREQIEKYFEKIDNDVAETLQSAFSEFMSNVSFSAPEL